MKLINQILLATIAATLVGCVEWDNSGPSPAQTSVPSWNQVKAGMTRQQVCAPMGQPLLETEQAAAWRGPEVKKGWPSNHLATSYWREYEAYFDSDGHVKSTRDFDRADHQ